MLALVSFDEEVTNENNQKGYNHCKRVIFHIDHDNVSENGILNGDENKKMMQYEDELIKCLEDNNVDCKFVGRMTYCAMRDFIFQVENTKNFDKAIQKWSKEIKDYEIELKESKGWNFFNNRIKPNDRYLQQIADGDVIDNLIKHGNNPEKNHFLEHVFIGERKNLEDVRNKLIAEDFEEIQFTDQTLVLGKNQKLNLDEVFNVTTNVKCPFFKTLFLRYI